MSYSVRQLARLSGVSVRTLHYYHEIGLLKPAFIKKNGYRSYEEKELILLQQILFFRELDFSLQEIRDIICRPNFQVVTALQDQRQMILLKQKRLSRLIKTIDTTIKHMNQQTSPQDEELYNAFQDTDVKNYQAEVKARWGNTQAYKQSQERTKKMTKSQMQKIKDEGTALTQSIADNMNKGIASPEIQHLITQHHASINQFYDCSLDMYRNLGKMYIEDPRFSTYYNKFNANLAAFMHQAINYYCDHK